jgi:hypothetical protein
MANDGTPEKSYTFRWRLPKTPTHYHFIQRDLTERPELNDGLKDADAEHITKLVDKVKALNLTHNKEVVLFGKALAHNHFLLQSTYVDPFEHGAGPEYKEKFHFGDLRKGEYEWYVEFDQHGKSDMWFRADWRKDRTVFFTELPPQPVKIGELWPLNVKLLHIEESLRVLNHFDKKGFAELRAVRTNAQGQRIAEVAFFSQEVYEWVDYPNVPSANDTSEGTSENKPSGTTTIVATPWKSDSWEYDLWVLSVVGYGEFLLDEGMWSRIVFQRIMNEDADKTSYNLQAMWLKKEAL